MTITTTDEDRRQGEYRAICHSRSNGRVLEKPRPDKHCPPPDSLFRSPPALLNEAKQSCNFILVYWVSAFIKKWNKAKLWYLQKDARYWILVPGWIFDTYQRILVSWVSAGGPAHQGNVQQVDCLAVGHWQTTNWASMEAGKDSKLSWSDSWKGQAPQLVIKRR